MAPEAWVRAYYCCVSVDQSISTFLMTQLCLYTMILFLESMSCLIFAVHGIGELNLASRHNGFLYGFVSR